MVSTLSRPAAPPAALSLATWSYKQIASVDMSWLYTAVPNEQCDLRLRCSLGTGDRFFQMVLLITVQTFNLDTFHGMHYQSTWVATVVEPDSAVTVCALLPE